VFELCFALGVRAITYNRMSPTGGAIHSVADLLPQAAEIEANLRTAERLGKRWKIHVSTAMPIMPCLVRIGSFKWVKFGFCSTGSYSPNIVIDAQGNVRSCNLSSEVLGNVVEQPFMEIMKSTYQQDFVRTLPEVCRGCAYERSCQGGCKESAFAVFGSLAHPEPLLHLAHKGQGHDL
jgi:radical SAM protein with 4Fe4S-binding SPASM domain